MSILEESCSANMSRCAMRCIMKDLGGTFLQIHTGADSNTSRSLRLIGRHRVAAVE